MFDGFTHQQIETQETTINLVRGGRGDPILLLPGYPQTHVCWHRVAPILAERFTVVCPDLRGFGDSAKPSSDPQHLAYSKRVMAQDQVEGMQRLGFNKFAAVGHSGLDLVLLLAMVMMLISIIHLATLSIPENEIVHLDGKPAKLDFRGTFVIITAIPGLPALIFFTTINNFLGGVFMGLMDAYGLSLVSVQVWGVLWAFLSCGFIVGGLFIAKWGLGKNPLRAMFAANICIWTVCSFFTIQPSIVLLTVGMFICLCVVPFIEAAEHTIIQKVVPQDRQGRVFGFAQSVEMAASPLTTFFIGPIAELIFIPFMTTGAGVGLIGGWFGIGADRGIALVFTLTGIIGLILTLIAMNAKYYKLLSERYITDKNNALPTAELT